MDRQSKLNLFTYSAFLLIAIAGILYGNSLTDTDTILRIWTIQNLLLLLIGIPFLFLQTRANLPNFWQDGISNQIRFIFPFMLGLIFGLFDLIIFKIVLHPEPYDQLPPFLQPFPYSIFLYFSGAFEIEIFYRLIPITLICLVGKWYKNGKYYSHFFLFAAIITSLREPLEQISNATLMLIIYSISSGFLMNLFQALFYKASGLLASLSLRLGHYLVWHILLGIYVQYIEL